MCVAEIYMYYQFLKTKIAGNVKKNIVGNEK